MSNNTHTPGPWSVRTHKDADTHGILSDTEPRAGMVAHVYAKGDLTVDPATGKHFYANPEQSLANARLIAAAPDMLEALNAAIPALERLGDFVGNVDHGGASGLGIIDRCALLRRVRDAVTKAEGKG